MNSLLVGIFVALAVWIFMKLRKSNSGLFKSLRPPPVRPSSQPPPEKREIPRIGVPGTITDEQFKALKRNLFEPSKDWSFEEAALILDAVTYLRAVYAEVAGKREPLLDVQMSSLPSFYMTKTCATMFSSGAKIAEKRGSRTGLPSSSTTINFTGWHEQRPN